jgi:hypothetical protein
MDTYATLALCKFECVCVCVPWKAPIPNNDSNRIGIDIESIVMNNNLPSDYLFTIAITYSSFIKLFSLGVAMTQFGVFVFSFYNHILVFTFKEALMS